VTEIKRDLYSAIDKAFSRLVQLIKRRLSAKSISPAGLLQGATLLPEEDLA
jgi:hypothetical protein